MADRWDDIFKALADASRRRIVTTLCRSPRSAGDLAQLVDLAPNAVSFHLRILRSAGLLSVHRQGRSLEYRLDPAALSAWLEQVNRLFPTDKIDSVRGRTGRQATPGGQGIQEPDRAAENGPLPTELL